MWNEFSESWALFTGYWTWFQNENTIMTFNPYLFQFQIFSNISMWREHWEWVSAYLWLLRVVEQVFVVQSLFVFNCINRGNILWYCGINFKLRKLAIFQRYFSIWQRRYWELMMKEPHSNEKKTSLTLSQINIISQTKFKFKQENILHALDILVWFTFKFGINLNLNQEVEFFTCILNLSEVLTAAQPQARGNTALLCGLLGV